MGAGTRLVPGGQLGGGDGGLFAGSGVGEVANNGGTYAKERFREEAANWRGPAPGPVDEKLLGG